jgi:penicillin G amidase
MSTSIKQLFLLFALLLLVGLVAGGCDCGDDDDDDDDNDDSSDDDDDDTVANPFEGIPLDETLEFPGLTSPVEVIRDEWGIPHIFAANQTDLVFVLAYINARDRLFQMDFLRHLTTGRLSEYVGSLALSTDVAQRARFLTNDGELVQEAMVDLLTDEETEILDAYSAGFNQYLADMRTGANGATFPVEFTETIIDTMQITVDDIPEWKPSDTLAIARYQAWDLSSTLGSELRNAAYFASVPADVLADTFRFAPAEDTLILPDFYSKKKSNLPYHAAVPDHIRDLDVNRILTALENMPAYEYSRIFQEHKGSNNWVFNGDWTESGYPMLANDPHLGHLNPSTFFEVQLDTAVFGGEEGYSSYGAMFSGIPVIIIGLNQYVAWGMTNVGYDVEDVYIETLNPAEDAVQFEGGWVDIEYSEQVIKLGPKDDSPTETRMIPYVPHHGPFVNGSIEDSGGFTHRWTGNEADDPVASLLSMLKSRDIDDFMAAAGKFNVGAQNFVGFDSEGNIGYNPHAYIPIRENVDEATPPYLPLPGDGDYEWNGRIADDQLPKAKNPDEGYIITANNDIIGNTLDNNPMNDPIYVGANFAEAFRAKRINELLGTTTKGSFTLDDFAEAQSDTLSPEGRRFLQPLLDAADNNPGTITSMGLDNVVDQLKLWDFSTPTGLDANATEDEKANAAACSIFYAFWTRVPALTFQDEFSGYGVPFPGRSAVWYLLENLGTSETGETLFDNINSKVAPEDHEDILIQALDEAVDWLASAEGFDTADSELWYWGELHGTVWEDVFAAFILPYYPKGPYPIDGGPYTVDVAAFSGYSAGDDSYDFMNDFGAQVRWQVEWTDNGIRARNTIPGGNSGVQGSEHYNDQAELWLNNETHEVRFHVPDVVENATERIRFEPAAE